MGDPLVRSIAISLVATSTFFSCCPAEAAIFQLGASNQAWYREDGFNAYDFPSNQMFGPLNNTFTGFRQFSANGPYFEYRSFFIFDVSSLATPIQSAKVQLYQRQYYSTSNTEEITLFEIETPADELPKTRNPNGVGIFRDLGEGNVLGQSLVGGQPTTSNSGSFIGGFLEIVLAEVAIAAINEAIKNSQKFAFGIKLTSFDQSAYKVSLPGSPTDGAGFESITFSSPNIHDPNWPEFPSRLVLESAQPEPPRPVSEPSALWGTLAASLLGFGLRRWRLHQGHARAIAPRPPGRDATER